ncbi:MAG: hypothetical protein IV107_16415 [Paucibacter sp.]|nr:hypothetical protein [Roseateles sp.]
MSNKDTLPPLPEPFGLFCGIRNDPPKTVEFWGMLNARETGGEKCNLYTADQMHTYAAACLLDAHARVAIAAQAPTAPAMCACKDRQASECPGEWEPGCDLGNNPKHAKVAPLPLPVQAEPKDGPGTWEENVSHLLDRCPYTVRQREGGGPECLISTLVVTFTGMQMRLQKDPMFAKPRQPAPAAQEPLGEREQIRKAQDEAVMPLIGPLLDAWENADREVMSEEPELAKWLTKINRAMETAGDEQEPTTWSLYVAGMIGCYLKWPEDDSRIEAVAGIIERRRSAQGEKSCMD